LQVWEYPKGPATSALVGLAAAAGAYSRFRTDPRIPPAKFAGLYATWIRRSTLHELADAVVVGARRDDPDNLLGMAALSVAGPVGRIGLIEVAPPARGRGLGAALLHAAHRRMLERGAAEARVVTQLANRAACAFYERAGYRVAAIEHVYHFWPTAEEAAAA
jgi:dTDP-4-amino-4,6-dideoxy-D-galactose acyltransferase